MDKLDINVANTIQQLDSNPDLLYECNLNFKEDFNSKEYFEPEPGEYAPKGSLWNNPMINKMRKNMKSDHLKYFEEQGEMYNYDFANADIDADLKDLTDYVICGLKSGMHPRDMTEDEKDAMCEIYGPTFYLKYGFTEEDVFGDE